MTQLQDDIARIKRMARYAAIAGTVLAVLCHVLPPHYRMVCDTIATFCKDFP